MDAGIDKEKLLHFKEVAETHLSDPCKMRLAVMAGMTAVGLLAVYMPLSDRIEQTQQRLVAENKRAGLITKVEALRNQAETYRPRIPEKSDTNEWVQYILSGLRESGVKLRDMSSRKSRKVGPYKAIVLTIEIEGSYGQVRKLLEWLDQSERLLRVDSMRCQKRLKAIEMKLTVLGLARRNVAAN